ncbi:MAG: hypothetical protein HYS24_13005 [Ignavibacteriales bacterium]|nr:hypothetical protein [Ignavibacteriales bacterium]
MSNFMLSKVKSKEENAVKIIEKFNSVKNQAFKDNSEIGNLNKTYNEKILPEKQKEALSNFISNYGKKFGELKQNIASEKSEITSLLNEIKFPLKRTNTIASDQKKQMVFTLLNMSDSKNKENLLRKEFSNAVNLRDYDYMFHIVDSLPDNDKLKKELVIQLAPILEETGIDNLELIDQAYSNTEAEIDYLKDQLKPGLTKLSNNFSMNLVLKSARGKSNSEPIL